MSPRKETTCPGIISLRIPSERRDVWAVAQSCWNHTFSAPCSLKRTSTLGRRKFSSIAQYRSEVTVTVISSSSEKYGPHTWNSKMAHHTVTLGLWSGRWWSSQHRKFCLLTAKSTLRHYRRTAILNELLDNKSAVLTRPSHKLRTAWTQLFNDTLPTAPPHPTPSYAAPKSGSSFCRTLYNGELFWWRPFMPSESALRYLPR
jgi:hypothetical protein